MVSGSGSASISRCGGRGAGDRQRAGDAIDTAAVLVRPFWLSLLIGHARADDARNSTGASASGADASATFLPRISPLCAARHGDRQPPRLFVPVGANPARLFGMDARDARLPAGRPTPGLNARTQSQPGARRVLAEPRLRLGPGLADARSRRSPDSVLTLGGRAGAGPCPGRRRLAAAADGDRGDGRSLEGLEPIDAETAELSYAELRKRERPFVMPLDPADPEPVERAAYDAAYKGVTDMLTLYLWRKPAFYLTRWAARGGHDAQHGHR